MSRPITLVSKQAIHAQETDKVFLVLLTINHTDLASSIRVVNNTQDIVSNGDTYIGFPFSIELPRDSDNFQIEAKLAIDNVDRQIVAAVRTITSAADVTLEIIRSDTPDVIEASFANFKLKNVSYNALTVSGTLVFERFDREPYPVDRITPNNFPGVF